MLLQWLAYAGMQSYMAMCVHSLLHAVPFDIGDKPWSLCLRTQGAICIDDSDAECGGVGLEEELVKVLEAIDRLELLSRQKETCL